MFEKILMTIAGLSLLAVIVIIVMMVIDRIRHHKTPESIRKWLISSAIIFLGAAFTGKAINDQQNKATNKVKTLAMTVINNQGQKVTPNDNEYQINSDQTKTKFIIQMNQKAQVGYSVYKSKTAQVTQFKSLANHRFEATVNNPKHLKSITIYLHAEIIGQRIGHNVIINQH